MENKEIDINDLPEYVKRLVKEYEDLSNKIESLIKFIEEDSRYKELDQFRQNLLITQLNTMRSYYGILNMRLNIELSLLNNSDNSAK